MKIIWKYCNHWQVMFTFLLMIGYSLDGVLLSSIVVYAGKLSTHSSMSKITLFGACSLLAWGTVYTANYFFSVNSASLVKNVNELLKQNLFWNSFSEQKSERKVSETISKLNNDMKLIENNYLKNVFPVISNILLSIVSLCYMLYLNITVSLVFIAFSFLPMIIPALFGKKLDHSAREWSKANKSFVEQVKDVMQGAAILKLYGASFATLKRTKAKIVELEKSNYRLSRIQAFTGLLSDLLSGISFIVPLVVGIYMIVLGNKLTFSILMAIFLANDRIVGPIRQVALLMSQIKTTTKLREEVISQMDDIPDIKQSINQSENI